VALVFYYGAGSPYAWRAWLALEHKQLSYERVVLSFSNRDTHAPAYARINPRGRVPALCDGDLALYESAAIVEYLEERFPDSPPLFPKDIGERALVRRIIREADTYVGTSVSALGKLLFGSRIEELDDHARHNVDEFARSLRAEVAFFENVLVGDYLAGELSAADLSLYPLCAILARFELRKPDLDLTSHIGPRLRGWMRRIEALPYFERTYPEHWRT
jgi:glutathione S-transferase